MDLGLQGKKAAIQGASSGLGFAVAKALADEGAHVVICSRDPARIQSAAKAIPNAHPLTLDLDRPGSGAQFIREAAELLGGIDILVTNSGGPPKGDFSSLTIQDWEAGYHRLWRSAIESIREALPQMQAQKSGRILLSTSTAAKEPIPHLTISNAYRAGLLGLMKSLSLEAAPHGITINALLPGYTRTKRMEEWGASLDQIAKEIPLGRLAEPEEFGALAAFLASSRAAYITGQAIACDGGILRGI